MRSRDILRRARGTLGTPFRPQGRASGIGLDCLGLIRIAYRLDEDRSGYRLSGEGHGDELRVRLGRHFRTIARERRRAGDLLLLRVARRQWHLAVWTGEGIVHADAGLRAVVERPGEPDDAIEAVFRRRNKER